MSNHTVPAAAEGMPTISRRTFLRSTAGATTLGGMVIMTTPSAAAPIIDTKLARLIEAHRAAYAALDAFSDPLAEAERAFYADRSSDEARHAKDEALATQAVLAKAERAAFVALLSYPVTTLAELRTIVAIGKATWWDHDGPEEEEADALLAGIMAGRG